VKQTSALLREKEIPTTIGEQKKVEAALDKLAVPAEYAKEWEKRKNTYGTQHRLAIDALQRFQDARIRSLETQKHELSAPLVEALKAKLEEMDKEAQYAYAPLQRLRKEQRDRLTNLREKERFLMDEKITTLIAENPEWERQIDDDIYHLRYDNPGRGTILDE